MSSILVIFDFDGTLVDSEKLCNQAFLDLLPNLDVTIDELIHRYRGRKLSFILSDIEDRIGMRLPVDFESCYRRRVEILFDESLRPTDGVLSMLGNIVQDYCIASSAPRSKIVHGLQVSGLSSFFTDPRLLFSSYEVGIWKPDPGLFRHVSKQMGYENDHCVVIDDSPVGIDAARLAGMHWLQYNPEFPESNLATRVLAKMTELPKLLKGVEMEIVRSCA